jgi:hypothetical protein
LTLTVIPLIYGLSGKTTRSQAMFGKGEAAQLDSQADVGMEPAVTQRGVFDMQVCVPMGWTDAQVVAFANHNNQCGTTGGWVITRDGARVLQGDPERAGCTDRVGYVHVMLQMGM